MALPLSWDPTSPASGTSPKLGDDHLRAIRQAIVDILGWPTDPTPITGAAFTMTAAGVLTVVQSLFNTKAIVPALGTLTTDTPVLNATLTWNNAAVTFHGLKIDVTDTASDSASRLLDLLVGGTSMFRVTKAGNMTLAGTLTLAGDPAAALQAATKQYVDGLLYTPTLDIFTSTGPWTKPTASGYRYSKVKAVGGGAGGGGVDLAANNFAAAGGGGAGAYAESLILKAALAATETVTVGAGGAGGVTGGPSGQNGVDGGTTSFGSLVVAPGGSGGTGTTTASDIGQGGVGGLASGATGDIKISGDDGESGLFALNIWSLGGTGAGSKLGARRGSTVINSANAVAGNAGQDYGSGGSGAAAHTSGTSVAGGAGSDGLVLVYNY